MPAQNMNGDVPPRSSARSHIPFRAMPMHTRVRLRFLRRCRVFFLKLKTGVPWSDVPRLILGLALVMLLYTSVKHMWTPHEPFDDVADMMRFDEMRKIALQNFLNQSETTHPSDITRNFNMTQVRWARAEWNYVYRELMHTNKTINLTKGDRRALSWLLKLAKYVLARKLKTSLHTSCNYLNDVADPADLSAFTCAPTSHKCPDGSFEYTTGFAPVEGGHISWDDIVIVIMLSADRSEYISAVADTWIRRLDPSASVVIARDGDQPPLPESLMKRQNVVVHDYRGLFGLDNLDLKAVSMWSFVLKHFQESGKKYFIKIDDDAYLVGYNLLRFLTKLDRMFGSSEEPIYFGHPFCGHGDLEALGYGRWCYAGGGAYGLNVEALGMLVRQTSEGCDYFDEYVNKAAGNHPVDDVYGGRYEDVMVGRCLRQAKNKEHLNGTSLLACGSFFPYAPLHYYEAFGRDVRAVSKKLDDSAITLHNLMPSAMRYMDTFLFESPIGGVSPFSELNPRFEGELLRICRLEGKKMHCDWPSTNHTRETWTTL